MKTSGRFRNFAHFLLLAFAAMISGCSCAPVRVPDVVGLMQSDAQAALTEAGLAVGVVAQAYSATVPVGAVIAQTPSAGASVVPGSAVDLTESLGPQCVPNVVGQTQVAACAAILEAGFKVGVATSCHSAIIAPGTVVSQTPEPGTAAVPGSEVSLMVSDGPPPVAAPGVEGWTQAAATKAIVDAGLAVGVVTQAYSSTVEAGRVVVQRPAAGILVPFGSAVSLTVSKGPLSVQVPSVVGQTPANAATIIAGAGLTLGTVTQAHSVTVPSEHVISQVPAAGESVVSGTAVALVLSLGPRAVSVPNVVGLPQETASTVLAGVNLSVGLVTVAYSSTIASGSVVFQDPAAGAGALEGTSVSLVLSKGPQPVVPNVLGMTRSAAESAIAGAELAVGTVSEEYSPSVPAGRVAGQFPAAGTGVDAGTTVSLVLSKGPQPVVPDLLGMYPADAERAIVEAGLILGTVTEDYSRHIPAGRVAGQLPAAGTGVDGGTKVSLVLSKGPQPVPVPNVVGETLEAASNAIVAADLGVGAVSHVYSTTVAKDRVISQNPSGGVFVLPGSVVGLSVSKGPLPVTVPDVVGMTQASAHAALAGAGLLPGPVTEDYSDVIPVGRVMEQEPAAGQTALTGSAVSLVLSAGSEMVSVPAGTFTMGNSGAGDDQKYGQPSEFPAHDVTLSAYQIGKYEVSNGQYCDVLNWALAQGYLKTDRGTPWTGQGDIHAGGSLQVILAITSPYCDIQYSGGVFLPKKRFGLPNAMSYSMQRHPVVQVTWYGSAAYCNWRSERQGLPVCYDMNTADWPLTLAAPASGGYRLPTEAEWERAAAWDGAKHWVYGYTLDTFSLLTDNSRCNFIVVNNEYDIRYCNPRGLAVYPYTSPVGWFNGENTSPNGNVATKNSVSPAGCYDMSGNVWEWCQDWYLDTYYKGGAMTNPTGPAVKPAPDSTRVLRGGTVVIARKFLGYPILSYLRTAARDNYYELIYADMARDDVGFGFRIARTP